MVFGKFFSGIKHTEHMAHKFKIPHEDTGCGGYKSGFHMSHEHHGIPSNHHDKTTFSYGGHHIGFDVSWNTAHTHSVNHTESSLNGAHSSFHICF
jgi:hypothetical protein